MYLYVLYRFSFHDLSKVWRDSRCHCVNDLPLTAYLHLPIHYIINYNDMSICWNASEYTEL